MKEDPTFAAHFRIATEEVVDEAEAELKRRGVHGIQEPVHYQGERVDTVTRKSDACLIFYLKGRRGDVFRDRAEISGPGGGPVELAHTVDLSKVPTERLRQMRDWLKEAKVEPVPTGGER
jgi:hypothetical protein